MEHLTKRSFKYGDPRDPKIPQSPKNPQYKPKPNKGSSKGSNKETIDS